MKTLLLIGILLFAAFADVADGQVSNQHALDSGVVVNGQTVIMGTWMWDAERNSQKRSPNVDLWWQQVNDAVQFLVPIGNARLAVLPDADYETLSVSELRSLKFSRVRISNEHIVPGLVLALQTNEGNLAKIRVVGFREMHDMSFGDARFAWRGWREYLASQPNRPNYHLEIEWTLYSRNKSEL